MRRRRFRSATCLAISLSLFVFSARASGAAESARPLRPAARLGAAFRLTLPRDLDEPALVRLGLDEEPAALKGVAVASAKSYAAYRDADRPAARAKFAEACAKKPQDPYCAMESARLATGSGGTPAADRKPYDKMAILAQLNAGDYAALKAHTPLRIAAAVSAYASYGEMTAAVAAARARENCDVGESASALAAKAEEFFPAQEAIDGSLALYAKAAACTSAATAAKARYRFGLIAVWQNRCPEADAAFDGLAASQAGYPYRARARYWRLRCAQQSGSTDVAESMRAALMKDHPLTFHNLAVNGSDPAFLSRLAEGSRPKVAARSALRPDANEALRAIDALIAVGRPILAAEATDLLSGQLAALEPEVRLYVATQMYRAEQGLAEFRLLSQLFQERPQWVGPETMRLYYPTWYLEDLKKRAGDVDPLLILSLIRQESGFNSRALSSVGARGLMQLMPRTARSFASVGKSKLFDPLVNLTVGTKFLRRSLDRFDGDVELTLAGYNAGAERAAKWAKRYPVEDRVLFIDLIPFKETREYVAAILRNYYWYVAIYGEGRLPSRAKAAPLARIAAIEAPRGAPTPAKVAAAGTSVVATPPRAVASADAPAADAAAALAPPLSHKTLGILAASAGARPSGEAQARP